MPPTNYNLERISQTIYLAHNYFWGLAGLKRNDTFLSSFPRSGSTWVRFILCNIISLEEWDGKTIDFNLLDNTMVELGISNLIKPWHYQSLPRIVKTHRNYSSIFGKHRAIGIIRDPRDVMISYYHYQKDRQGVFSGQLTNFIHSREYGLENWFQHYQSWRNIWQLAIRYEDLRFDTLKEIHRILNYLDISITDTTIQEAIERSNIRRIKKIDSQEKSNHQASFARRGDIQQWKSIWSQTDLQYFDSLCKKNNFHLYTESAEEK